MSYPFPDNTDSYWLKGRQEGVFPEFQGDMEADVTIVGGGVAGLVVAYILKRSGLRVVVLEQKSIAGGTTGGTTGKVTSQHGIFYSDLIKRFGKNSAKVYADGYQQALEDIEYLIRHESISCQLSRQDSYVYTTNPKQVSRFEREAIDSADLGLPATFEKSLELPFGIKTAVKFSDQFKIDAYDFTLQLAQIVDDGISRVFEDSKVIKIRDGKSCLVETSEGVVRSKHVVVTTLIPPLPMLARFSYAASEYPETSYVVAARVKKGFDGMYISPDSDNYSLLPLRYEGQDILLIGGESHIPGLGNASKRQQKLITYAKKWFDVEEITNAWGAMDYMAYDGLPLFGKVYPWSKNTFAVSGLKKWGLAGSMLGAKTILSLINQETTDATKLFTPHRLSAPFSVPRKVLSSWFTK